MKFAVVICSLLICLSLASASFPPCPEVSFQTKVIGTWTDGSRGGQTFTQFDVTIVNNSNQNIKQMVIFMDAIARIRDGTALWNLQRLPNNDLVLPYYQDLNAHATYTFGFILQGTAPANFYVKHYILG